MKGSSKVIMGATLAMIVSIAILLGLVLILLAELYCSLLLRRKPKPLNSPIPNSATTIAATSATPSSLSNFYSHGVIDAPRNVLFPWVFRGDSTVDDLEKRGSETQQTTTTTAAAGTHYHSREKNTASLPSSSSSAFLHLAPPKLVYEVPHHGSAGGGYNNDEICGGDSGSKETFIYICNPIYDNDGNRGAAGGGRGMIDTPFETPDSSPSRLEGEDCEHGDEEVQMAVSGSTPPLTPMKKLPAEAVSVNLRDARSLATSGSDSNSNNEGISSTLSSSGSPSTSPSW